MESLHEYSPKRGSILDYKENLNKTRKLIQKNGILRGKRKILLSNWDQNVDKNKITELKK